MGKVPASIYYKKGCVYTLALLVNKWFEYQLLYTERFKMKFTTITLF